MRCRRAVPLAGRASALLGVVCLAFPGAAQEPPVRILVLTAPGPLMVRVAEGPFVFGSSTDEILTAAAACAAEPLGHRCTEQTFANELGRRRVHLPSFWIDRTEVTVREYARCVDAGRCSAPGFAAGGERFSRPDYPVTFVSWYDAVAYCAFRGARLPTELEFERAARGSLGRTYPWGNFYNAGVANHGRYARLPNDTIDGHAELAPVASYPAGRTPDGLLDLAGNAAEWVADAYRSRYAVAAKAVASSERRSVRGGSWASAAPWLRGATRDSAAPDTRRPDLGFRCARSVPAGATP